MFAIVITFVPLGRSTGHARRFFHEGTLETATAAMLAHVRQLQFAGSTVTGFSVQPNN